MLADEKAGTPSITRVVAGLLIAGLIATSGIPIFSAISNLATGSAPTGSALTKADVSEKLRRVPLFAVTDETGRPYMSESADARSRVGYFFVSPSDADKFLDAVRQSTVQGEGGLARVRVVSLEDAIPYVLQRPRGGGKNGVPERFELVSDKVEAELADVMTDGKFQKTFKKGVPLFYVDSLGLEGKDSEGPVIPLFFEKEKLDSFLKQARDSGNPIQDEQVQIIDLLQTVRELREGANSGLKRVILFPMDSALQSLNEDG